MIEKMIFLKKGIMAILILGVVMIALSVFHSDGNGLSIFPKETASDDAVYNTGKAFYDKIEERNQKMLDAQENFAHQKVANDAFAEQNKKNIAETQAAAEKAKARNAEAMADIRSKMQDNDSVSSQKVAEGQQIVADRQAKRISSGN